MERAKTTSGRLGPNGFAVAFIWVLLVVFVGFTIAHGKNSDGTLKPDRYVDSAWIMFGLMCFALGFGFFRMLLTQAYEELTLGLISAFTAASMAALMVASTGDRSLNVWVMPVLAVVLFIIIVQHLRSDYPVSDAAA